MTRIVCSLVLTAAMAGLMTAGGLSVAPAQDKKKEPKSAKGGVIEINEGKDGKFRFTVRDGEGKYLGGSAVGYATKDEAVKAVDALKATLPSAKVEMGKKDDKEDKKKGDKSDK